MRRSRTHQWAALAALALAMTATVALAACGSGEPRLAESPLPTPTISGTLVFENVVAYRQGDIYVVNTDGTGLKALAVAPNWADAPSWSPDGSNIVWGNYPAEGNDMTLWVMKADGSGQRPLAPHLQGNHAVWSPDGARIAFMGGSDSIWVVNADGSDLRRVTQGSKDGDAFPAWAPDGRVFFLRSHKVFAVNLDGSGLQQVTKGYAIGGFGLSPDGKTLAIHDYMNNRIVAIPVDGNGSPVTLLDQAYQYIPLGGVFGCWVPGWSPDGKALVLTTTSLGGDTGPRLYIVNADGSGLSAVPGVKHAMDAAWGPK
jgi:Tol biopolymer transport system component